MTSMLRRTEWCWRAWLVGAALGVLAALGFFTLVLHGANLYPRFRAVAENEQRNGAYVWQTTCGEGKIFQPEALVQCQRARQMAELSVRSVALEHTLEHLWREMEDGVTSRLGWLNPLRWIHCGPDTTCHYVIWKCVDMLVSSTVLLICVVVFGLVLLGYAVWRGPLRTFSELNLYRAQRQLFDSQLMLAANKLGGGSNVPVELYGPTLRERVKPPPALQIEGEMSD